MLVNTLWWLDTHPGKLALLRFVSHFLWHSLCSFKGVSWAWTWYRCAARPPHTHPINVYWNMEKSIPINIYTIIGDNNKYSLFPFRLGSFMQTIITSVKYWIINFFLSENNTITWRDKSQVVRLSTAGDWMEGYKCILEMKSWPIDV